MGNNSSSTKDPYTNKLVGSESSIDVQIETDNNVNVMSAMAPETTADRKMITSETSAAMFQPNTMIGGFNFDETEIEVQLEDIEHVGGGDLDSESSIQIETETIEEMAGGAVDSEFDANKLLNTIMQMGGDADTESSEPESSIETSDLPNTSSFKPYEKKHSYDNKKFQKKSHHNDDDDDSSSSSESSSSSFVEEDDSSSSDSESDNKVSDKKLHKALTKTTKNNSLTASDVYIMSDTESSDRNINLLSFNDPLKYKKSKK